MRQSWKSSFGVYKMYRLRHCCKSDKCRKLICHEWSGAKFICLDARLTFNECNQLTRREHFKVRNLHHVQLSIQLTRHQCESDICNNKKIKSFPVCMTVMIDLKMLAMQSVFPNTIHKLFCYSPLSALARLHYSSLSHEILNVCRPRARDVFVQSAM